MSLFGSNPRTTNPSANPASTPSSSSNGAYHSSSPSAAAANRLSAGVSIKGNVTFRSELVIDGKVEGDITSTGKLIIGAHGKVIGDIQAGFVTIQGNVEGNILASERCALQASGSLEGDIESPRLVVDENASFIGSATVKAKKS